MDKYEDSLVYLTLLYLPVQKENWMKTIGDGRAPLEVQ